MKKIINTKDWQGNDFVFSFYHRHVSCLPTYYNTFGFKPSNDTLLDVDSGRLGGPLRSSYENLKLVGDYNAEGELPIYCFLVALESSARFTESDDCSIVNVVVLIDEVSIEKCLELLNETINESWWIDNAIGVAL